MKIAVIDGGVDKRFLSRGHLLSDMIAGPDGGLYERTTEAVPTEHGQPVQKLLKNMRTSREFYSLSVFDNEEMKRPVMF